MSFTDFIALQNDHAHVLLCDDWLASVNIVTRDRLLLPDSLQRLPDQTLAAEVLAYITERNGRMGCGVIVEVPEFSVESPNISGPQGNIIHTFLVLEEPGMNCDPDKGTNRPADQVAQKIVQLLHQDADEGNASKQAVNITAAEDFRPLRAFRVRIRSVLPRASASRCAAVAISVADGSATLSCATSGAEIWFTLNQSFPGKSNPQATLYSAPIPVTSGDVLRAGAYLADSLPSPRRKYTVT